MSQLIELLWRNRAYHEGQKDPHPAYPERKGAMFAGFKTEIAGISMTPEVKDEWHSYDRLCVYPGRVSDHTNDYCIGPRMGVDPATLDLPQFLAYPRTIKTDVFTPTNVLTTEDFPGRYHKNTALGADADSRADRSEKPAHYHEPGMLIRKRARREDDTTNTSNTFAVAGFSKDINYGNAGDTTVSIDLEQSIAGVGATLKKIVLQFSKTDHQISEIVIDFSDVTRGSGSIASSENPQGNLLTVLLDGHGRVHTATFDCRMGKFASGKFHLGVRSISYYPALACEAGGFDPGSQVAAPSMVTLNCEKNYEPASTLQQEAPYEKASIDQAFPNPLRGQVNDSSDQPNNCSGHAAVRDAVNMGYQLVGPGKTNGETYVFGTSIEKEANISTVSRSDKTQVEATGIQWKMPAVSSYSFKPRQSRGTLLAMSVLLQADPHM